MLPGEEEEEVPLQEMRRRGGGSSRRRLEVQVPQLTPVLEAVVERSRDTVWTNVTFASPLTTDRPSGSTAPVTAAPVKLHSSDPVAASAALEPSLFAAYQTPNDSPSAAREALRQVNLVMEQVKVMHEDSQVAYNASTVLQTNVKVSYLPIELLNAIYMSICFISDHPLGCAYFRVQEVFHFTRFVLSLSVLSELVGPQSTAGSRLRS